MLKGMAIFLVIMGHVLTMCIRGIDRAFLFKLIGEIHMPLFFFISGWFTLRFSKANGRLLFPHLGKRFLQLIVPMVAVSTIWIYYFPHSGLESPLNSTFYGLWTDLWKNGYWFTLCLFEIILIYSVLIPLLRKLDRFWIQFMTVVIFWAIMVWVCRTFIPEYVQNWFSLGLIYYFFPIFMGGWICRYHKDRFHKLLKNSFVILVSMVVGGAAFYAMAWPWELPWLNPWLSILARPVMHICLVFVVFASVIPWSEKCFSEKRVGQPPVMAKIWCKFGEVSLGVYLVHYFFLFPMGSLRPILEQLNLSLIPLTVLATITAAAIALVTWLIIYILKRSKISAWLLTGELPFGK